MPRKITFLSIIWVSFLVSPDVKAQTQYPGFTNYNWFFGNSTYSIHFNKGIPIYTYLDSVQTTPYGIAGNGVATNQVTGELLFYSDGSTVYDATHRAMPGAVSRPAVTANQGIALSPVPGNDDQYYIFAINGAGDVDFSIVDLSLSGNPPAQFGADNLGDVTIWRQDLPGSAGNNVSEAMVVVPKPVLSSGYWLITQQANSTIYKVMDIGPSGLGSETSFDLLADGAVPFTAAHFGIEPTGNIAVAPKDPNKNIHLLLFNASSGTISYTDQVLNSATSNPTAAGSTASGSHLS